MTQTLPLIVARAGDYEAAAELLQLPTSSPQLLAPLDATAGSKVTIPLLRSLNASAKVSALSGVVHLAAVSTRTAVCCQPVSTHPWP